VYVGSFANFSATLAALNAALMSGRELVLVCAGTEGASSLEDAACAGAFVRMLRDLHPTVAVSDGAQMCEWVAHAFGDDLVSMAAASEHGRRLQEYGYASDVEVCCTLDCFPVLAAYRDRAILREPMMETSAAEGV
jgi:2-phosphosulfolactate phosphatase